MDLDQPTVAACPGKALAPVHRIARIVARPLWPARSRCDSVPPGSFMKQEATMALNRWLAGAAVALAMIPGVSSAAVTEDNFLVRNAGDLVALCSTEATDPLAVPAIHFCHGFGLGTVRVLNEIQRARRVPQYCLPAPLPTRNDALAAFIKWVKASEARAAQDAPDAILAFMVEQYPCPTRKK
ncbi:MAG: Rap1a/Tai family immunity protein [Rhodospirillales bacterium]